MAFRRTAVLVSKRSGFDTPQHHNTTTPQHHNTTTPQHHNTTSEEWLTSSPRQQAIGTPQYQLAFIGSEERPCLCPGDSARQHQTIHTSTTTTTNNNNNTENHHPSHCPYRMPLELEVSAENCLALEPGSDPCDHLIDCRVENLSATSKEPSRGGAQCCTWMCAV
jgi:hypothetical protein